MMKQKITCRCELTSMYKRKKQEHVLPLTYSLYNRQTILSLNAFATASLFELTCSFS
jgi:hypothetical protein